MSRFCIFFIIMVFSSHLMANSIIQEMGLRPLNQEPIEFSLQNLQGEQKNLSDFKGQWIWLVFWATWCAVCQTEIPTLESLYQEFKDSNLLVLGVSLDQNLEHLREYVKNRSITFPTLHDASQNVGLKYQASGVPTLYLISPDWRVVGLAQGALNWERKDILEKVKKVLSIKSIESKEQETLGLPDELKPPLMKVKLVSDFPTPHRWMPLEITIEWSGPSNRYLIQVPKFEILQGTEIGKISSQSSVHLKYIYPLKFKEVGQFHLGPILLNYRARNGFSDQTVRHPGIDIEIKKRSFSFSYFIVGGAALLFLIMGGLWYWYQKKNKKVISHLESQNEKWEEFYQKARTMKISGQQKEYVLELLAICGEIQSLPHELHEREQDFEFLKKMEINKEKIQYGNFQLQESEILRLEKIIEKTITKEK